MNTRSVKIAGSLVGLASMGLVWSALAADPTPSEFGRAGNKGEGTSTDVGPRQPHSTPEQDTQVTLGGARPTLMGEVLKIDGEFYTIKDSGGGEVRVRVDRNTSLDCAMGQGKEATFTTGRQSAKEAEEIPPTRHMQEQTARAETDEPQKGRQVIEQQQEQSTATGQQSGTQSPAALGQESGGDVARGSGFVVGPKSGCDFKAGDKVKAEVSDLGTALFLKKISDRELAPSARGPQALPEHEGGMTPGEKAAAQQRAEMMKPGGVPAAPDLQDTEAITREQRTAKAAPQPKASCDKCQVLRGLVLRVDNDSLVLKAGSKKEAKEIRIKLDKETIYGQVNPRNQGFLEGDRIEAYVRPDGRAHSIGLLKQTHGIPGVEGDVGGG